MKKIFPAHPIFSMQDFATINSQWFHDLVSSFTSLSMGLELSTGSNDEDIKTIVRESRERLNYHLQCLRQLLVGKSSTPSLNVLKNYLNTIGLTLWYAPSIQNEGIICEETLLNRDQIFLALGLWLSKKTNKQKGHIYVGSDFITLWLEDNSWEDSWMEKKTNKENGTNSPLAPEGVAFQKVPLKPLFVQQGERDVLITGKGKEEGDRVGYGLYTHHLALYFGFALEFCNMESILSYICSALAYYDGLIPRGFNKILSPREQKHAWELSFWLLSRLNGVPAEDFQLFPLHYYKFWLDKIKDMGRGPCYLNFPWVSILTINLNPIS